MTFLWRFEHFRKLHDILSTKLYKSYFMPFPGFLTNNKLPLIHKL